MGRELRPGTQVIRSARSLPPGEGAPVAPPLVQSVAFDYRSAADQDRVFGGEKPGYVYGRYGNPTVREVERRLATRSLTVQRETSGTADAKLAREASHHRR